MSSTNPPRTTPVVVVGLQADEQRVQDMADRLLDSCTIGLQEFSTEELEAIADLRDRINPGGWMQTMIRQYVEVWR